MSISVELSGEELSDLRLLTKQDDQAEAIRQALREFLRMSRLRELIAVSGQVEFDDNSKPANWRKWDSRLGSPIHDGLGLRGHLRLGVVFREAQFTGAACGERSLAAGSSRVGWSGRS